MKGIGAFVDVETTGLDTKADEIVEMAIVLFKYDLDSGQIAEIVDEYCSFNEPSREIPRKATSVHGIRKKDVRGHRLDHDKVTQMIEKADFIAAHNAKFDRGFIQRYFPVASNKQWYCSMNGIPWRSFGFKKKSLESLLHSHNINIQQKHRALDDVHLALQLLKQPSPDGQIYLKLMLKKPLPPSTDQEVAATTETVQTKKPILQSLMEQKWMAWVVTLVFPFWFKEALLVGPAMMWLYKHHSLKARLPISVVAIIIYFLLRS